MSSAHAFVYEHCDVPPGMSLVEWRRTHTEGGRRRSRAWALLRWPARLLMA